MNEVKTIEQLSLILGYLVPGLIIVYLRAQFLTGRIGPHKDALLSYFTLSVIYLTVVNAVTTLITGDPAPFTSQTPYWLPIMLGGSVMFGLLVGLNAKFGVTRRLLGRFGLNLPHVLTTAWDFRFSRLEATFMTVTLKDGSQIFGWCGLNSFVGSDPQNRDLYIEQVYDPVAPGQWDLKTEGKGIYISAGDIKLIEFTPPEAV